MAYKDPPQLPASALNSWTHYSANYYWHPGAQQSDHPHFHLSGSTVSDVVKVSFLKYTTGGEGGNINVNFTKEHGYAHITDDIQYKMAYNIRIDDLNQALIKED